VSFLTDDMDKCFVLGLFWNSFHNIPGEFDQVALSDNPVVPPHVVPIVKNCFPQVNCDELILVDELVPEPLYADPDDLTDSDDDFIDFEDSDESHDCKAEDDKE